MAAKEEGSDVLKNYLTITLRNLMQHKVYTLINILGLAIGLACCILLLLFVQDELRYDRFHENADRIYRITFDMKLPNQPRKHFAITTPLLAPVLEEDFPEFESVARLEPYFEAALPGKGAISYGENEFNDQFYWTDGDLLEVFSFPLLQGSPETALKNPGTAVVTESAGRRYFGDEGPVGKRLKIDTGFSEEFYRVVGVLEDIPENSHIQFDVLISMASLESVTDPRAKDYWWGNDTYTYALLQEGVDPATVIEKMPDFIEKHFGRNASTVLDLRLQPLTDIHLKSKLLNEMSINGDILYVYIFCAVAFLTLLIACINFMNLSTARSANRAKEVGMRKMVGAYRSDLVIQFLTETVLLSLFAMALAILVVWLVLPAFNVFTAKAMALEFGISSGVGLLALILLVGVLAGSYPAFFLSAFKPIDVLKGFLSQGSRSGLLRKILVIFQFSFSVVLIFGTYVIYRQLDYMQHYDLGVDMDRVLVVPVRDVTLRDRYLATKDELSRHSNVQGTALSSLVVGWEAPLITTREVGSNQIEAIGTLVVDQEFADFFNLEVIAGRNFDRSSPSDVTSAFILNERAARNLGWADPHEAIGKQVDWGGDKVGEVVGVVKDFHYQPLKFEIQPLLLHIRPIAMHYIYIKLGSGDLAQSVQAVEDSWDRIFPGRAFEYSFLDDEFQKMYRGDSLLGKTLGMFALVAIFVACLGLLGLASFTAEQRTREIGIRKILGSSVTGIVLLLSKDFTRLILLATLIAWPVSFLLMRDWLEDFAYRIDLGPGTFLISGLAALLIAWLTVSFQAFRAARRNPAEALHYE